MRRTDGTTAGSADAGRTPRRCGNSPTRAAGRRPLPARTSAAEARRRPSGGSVDMPSAPIPIQTALLILTPIRSNRCAQLLRRHPPQGGTPMLLHGACFSTHQHTPTHTRAPSPQHAPHAPCIPLAAHRKNRHTQPARLHPPQAGRRRYGTAHASARTSTHQHAPTRTSPASSSVSTARAPRPMLPEKPAIRARHKLRHRSRHPCNPYAPGALLPEHIANSGFDWAPHDAQLSRSTTSPPSKPPKTQPYGHKKRSDLSI